MTVAIAALCGFPNDISIIAVEDHMVTSGDIEFEQPQPKMWRLGTHCVAMLYGLSAAQAEIALRTEIHVQQEGLTDIGSIADSYATFLRDYIRREAEADILAPLSLTTADLVRRPTQVNQALLLQLSKQMQTYYRGSGLSDDLGGAIIIGTDGNGVAHIYRVEDGHTTLMDSIGFVAAGGGQWHAESQFMFSGYTRWWAFPDALSLVYAAKKRAEVAPGVGAETDIVLVTTKPPNVIHANMSSDLVRGLDTIYIETKKKQDEEFAGQHARVKAFLNDLLKPTAEQQTAAAPVGEIGPGEAVVEQPLTPTPSPRLRKRKAMR